MTRRFIDAASAERCQATITLRDKSKAQCGRRAAIEDFCTQHARKLGITDGPPYTSTRYADEMPEADFYGEG